MRQEEVFKYEGAELNKSCKISNLKYLVVGTGRSGTVYIAKLLTSLGIPCTHEAIFKYDGIENAVKRLKEPLQVSEISKLASVEEEARGVYWFKDSDLDNIQAESSYMAVPFLQHECLKDVAIIHAIREPMKVINSFVHGFQYFQPRCLHEPAYKEYHEFIYSHIPRLYDNDLTPVDKAALYWCEWNEMAERLAKGKRYCRIVLERSLRKLFSFVGANPNDPNMYQNKEANRKVNMHVVYEHFSQIPADDIRKRTMALRDRYYSILLP